MKKTDFLKFLKSKYACSESQDWIKSLPVEDIDAPIWAKYLAEAQPDWAVWLAQNIEGDITTEYKQAQHLAYAEYEHVTAPARAEYERVWEVAWVEYERAISPARAEYERIEGSARAEYERAISPARAEYKRIRADTARKLLTFKAVSQVVDNFLKTC